MLTFAHPEKKGTYKMKLKPPSRKNLLKSRLKRRSYHYWLLPEQPKKTGRLGQLNKANRRLKRPSEFVVMANKIEQERMVSNVR